MPATLDFAEVLAKSAGGILTIIILYSLSTGIYNIYFHPLAGIPGPKLWCATRSRNLLSLLTGTLSKEIRQLHEEYGDVIRVAPDEVSFARTEAWHEIYPNAPGRPGFPKSRLWFGTKPGDPISILHALEPKNHARFRKSIERGFTESSLRAQEPIIQKYGEMLISRLKKLVAKKKNENGVVVDVNRWYAFTTFDVIGDLGFGESFGCLESNDYPPWVLMLFNSLRAQTLAVSLRFYPSIDWLLKLAIPKSVMEKEKQHREWSMKKLDRRLNIEKERPDIVSLIKMDDEGINGLTITEMQATCTVIIVAGSETTVAVLSGTTNYLVKNPDKLAILSAELRGKFRSDHDITLSALKDLPYLNAVIQEGMRMCNPVLGGLVRESPPGGRTVCGYFLPAGTIVNVHAVTLSLSFSHFYLPEKFVPERWLASVIEDTDSPFYHDDREAVQIFGVGPRACVGRLIAWAELRLILARIIWNFDMSEVESVAGKLYWADQRVFSAVERKPFEVRLRSRMD